MRPEVAGDRPVPGVRRRAGILAALYGLPAVAWGAFSTLAVPPIIRAAHQGRSLDILNRLFRRRIPHPVEHYLDLWRVSWQAVLLGWLCHLAVVLVVLGTDRWLGPTGEASPSPPPGATGRARRVNRVLIGFSLAFLALTVLSGPRQDYVAFLEIWDAVRAGRDPWWVHERYGYPINAYGPLFNPLAPLAWLNPLAPKLLFATSYCLFVVVFLKGGMARRGPEGSRFPVIALLAWFLGPFPWVEVAYYGHFDVLVGIACVAATALVIRGREALSGVCLALGFLLKLIPVVVMPFFAIDHEVEGRRRRVRIRLLACAGVLMALGYGLSFPIWGPATFRPFTFGYTRGSELLSIFRYLRGGASPLRWFVAHPDLDAWSTRCLAVAWLSVFLYCQGRRADPATSAVLAVLTTLLFYQVGFPQYQMILFLLVAYWLALYATILAQQCALAVALVAYFGWLSLFDVFYAYAGGVMHADGPWGWVADRVGLPTFLLGSFLQFSLLRVAGRVRIP